MKSIIIFLIFLIAVNNSFAQIPLKKQMVQAKDTIKPISASSTILQRNTVVKPTPTNSTNTSSAPPVSGTVLHQRNSIKTMADSTKKKPALKEKINITGKQTVTISEKKTKIIPGPKYSIHPIAPDIAKANLLDAFISVTTGATNVLGTGINDNKDPNTHWSCGTFDQNETPVTSFHDNSDNDEYANGSKNILKMHVDKAALFGDFQNGRLHINIAPVGHDTWIIKEFTLTMDFINPKSTQKLTWNNITLTQDKRDADLFFYYDGTNFVVRQ